MMRATGNSMLPRINEGDLVIARRATEPHHGRVYICVNDEECLIKIVRLVNGTVILESLNASEYPMFAAAADFRVEGEVKQTISGKI